MSEGQSTSQKFGTFYVPAASIPEAVQHLAEIATAMRYWLKTTKVDGRTPRESCIVISAHHSKKERGLHHHDEEARGWCRCYYQAVTDFVATVTAFYFPLTYAG